MDNKKIVVAMDIATTGKGGGPYTSTTRTMESALKEKYEFKVIHYKTELGSGISWKRIKDIKAQLKTIQPDIVHFTGLQLSGFHMAIACLLTGVNRTVVTVRGFSGDAIYFGLIKKTLMTFLFEPFTLLLSKRIIGVSNYVLSRKMIKMFWFKKKYQVYNFPPILKTQAKPYYHLREQLDISAETIVVVTVARINKDKGYHIYDDVIQRFDKNKKIKFIVVGQGSYLEEMKLKLGNQIASGQVHFLGYRSDISAILQECDVFVLPTLHETLSVALLEASQHSLALIGSNTGGVPEIIEHNYNGLLVEPGNKEALYEALREVVGNDKLRVMFARNAKQKILDKFSDPSIVKKLDIVYQSLL